MISAQCTFTNQQTLFEISRFLALKTKQTYYFLIVHQRNELLLPKTNTNIQRLWKRLILPFTPIQSYKNQGRTFPRKQLLLSPKTTQPTNSNQQTSTLMLLSELSPVQWTSIWRRWVQGSIASRCKCNPWSTQSFVVITGFRTGCLAPKAGFAVILLQQWDCGFERSLRTDSE